MSERIHGEAAGEDFFYRAFEEEFRGSRELIEVVFLPPVYRIAQANSTVSQSRGSWLRARRTVRNPRGERL